MKFFSGFLSLVLALSIFVAPTFAVTNDPMPAASDAPAGDVDVASMFWPIVPGTTVADGTFFFKQMKEGMQGMFTFGNINQARYLTELSKKRIVEANKLMEDKDYGNAIKSLGMSEDKRKAAIEAQRKAAEADENTVELANFMVDAFQKEEQVLKYFSVAIPADQKAAVDSQLKNIELQISEAK